MLDEKTCKLLAKIKPKVPAKFVLIKSGASVGHLVVFQKGELQQKVTEAKSVAKGAAFVGVVRGGGGGFTFQISEIEYTTPPTSDIVLKTFLTSATELSIKSATYQLVKSASTDLFQIADRELEEFKSSSQLAPPTISGAPNPNPPSDPPDQLERLRAMIQKRFEELGLKQLSQPDIKALKLRYGEDMRLLRDFVSASGPADVRALGPALSRLENAVKEKAWIFVRLQERWQLLINEMKEEVDVLIAAIVEHAESKRPEELREALSRTLRDRRSAIDRLIAGSSSPLEPSSHYWEAVEDAIAQASSSLSSDPLFAHLAKSPAEYGTKSDLRTVYRVGLDDMRVLLKTRQE